MKAIVSLKKDDGSYHEVGMNHRFVAGPYERESTIRLRAAEWAKGQSHRIEFFAGSLLDNPYKTEYRDL